MRKFLGTIRCARGYAKLATLATLTLTSLLHSKSPIEHERLRYQNKFKKPEQVVSYYCSRDASGFVWSGLLEIERKAFTTWKSVPNQDSFYIAKRYKVGKAKMRGTKEAIIKVDYHLTGVGDAHGTRMPPSSKKHQVTFKLKKVKGAWKIASPSPKEIAPVVTEAKFRFARSPAGS